MKIIVTAEELIDKFVWEDFCKEFEINTWAVNEGLMDPSEEFTLTKEQAIKYGFIRDD